MTFQPVLPLKPPLKWAGGKRWQVPHIRKYWEPHSHRRLVEPFCGGLSIALGFMPERALLNDINPHLINFYLWLQRGLTIEIKQSNSRTIYSSHRKLFNQLLSDGLHESSKAAQLFYYLNRTGYNGLCRFNRDGEFNVPFGQYKKILYKCDLTEYSSVFSKWKFSNTYFDKIKIKPGDFIYADPPYDVVFRQYSKDGFGWNEQVKVAEWLADHTGPVILSNQATNRIVDLYRQLGFSLEFLDAPRRISCTGDRTPAREVIAIRNL